MSYVCFSKHISDMLKDCLKVLHFYMYSAFISVYMCEGEVIEVCFAENILIVPGNFLLPPPLINMPFDIDM